MSNLSELLPAGAGAKSADFVASGTLGSGVTVALNSDGTVSVVAETSISTSLGTPTTYDADYIQNLPAATFDSVNNKVVIFYSDFDSPASYGTAVVGTVSGSSISFGTPVVFSSTTTRYFAATFDSNAGKVVVAYQKAGESQRGRAKAGTVSGTSISFGAEASFYNGVTINISMTYDANAQKIVIVWEADTPSDWGAAIVGTVSGTTISFGSKVDMVESIIKYTSIAYDANAQKVVVVYEHDANSDYGTALVGTVSGTSISFGTPVVFASTSVEYVSAVYDPTSGKIVASYSDLLNSRYGKSVIGEVSGTSISFGSPVTFNSASTYYIYGVFSTIANKVVLVYQDNGSSPSGKGTIIAGAVSGASISFDSAVAFTSNSANEFCVTYDSNAQKVVIGYGDAADTGAARARVATISYTATNNTDFIGITDQAIADTATGAVIVQGGVSEKLSGLTVGADYYVQADGVLASDFIPYDISGATFTGQTFSVASQDTQPQDLAFNSDGTKLFVVGWSASVYEYDLTTGFDLSTASYSQSFSTSSQEGSPQGIAFNSDGTKMYIVGQYQDTVFQYNLSTGFDISTASYSSSSFSLAAQETDPRGIAFNTDGTKMFIVGFVGDDVNEYSLSTGFDLSTASYSQNFSIAAQETTPSGLVFNPDGTKMFVAGSTGDDVNEYSLSTGFDISTASYALNFSVASEETLPVGLAFNADGTAMFLLGDQGNDINKYSTTAASTTVPAGRALSTTSILLEG